jgi:hypothetical protein
MGAHPGNSVGVMLDLFIEVLLGGVMRLSIDLIFLPVLILSLLCSSPLRSEEERADRIPVTFRSGSDVTIKTIDNSTFKGRLVAINDSTIIISVRDETRKVKMDSIKEFKIKDTVGAISGITVGLLKGVVAISALSLLAILFFIPQT